MRIEVGNEERIQERNTQKLLKLLTDHLSYREECKYVDYQLKITETENGSCVSFHPNIRVFPSRHIRCEADKIPILEHICKYHLQPVYGDKVLDIYPSGLLMCEESLYKTGTYTYGRCFNKRKRRNWFYTSNTNNED